MFSFESLEFLLVMKVLNCVFVIVFAVWTCDMVWEVFHGCRKIVDS